MSIVNFNPSLIDLLAQWQGDDRFMENVAVWRTFPPIPAQTEPWPAGLDARVVDAARRDGIGSPYSHQAQAIDAALQGRHVVLVTETASGKTLGYNAPVLHALLTDPDARALYLFPTKALAQDQMVAFNRLVAGHKAWPLAATYDGDTPQSRRKKIRQENRVIITNPDMLHTGILPHHPRWRKFLANLRWIIIDELHIYRGVFGSHFANVLRRMQRICRFYGAAPQFVAASATIANPHQHALALLDLPDPHRLTVIDRSGAPRGKRHVIFYNPPVLDAQTGVRQGIVNAVNSLSRELLGHQAQTVVFGRARLTVEVLLTYLQDFAREQDWPLETIRGYRGGYLPLTRREIETGLRDGMVKGVVATNALELGVDIGGLNAAVLAGYPGTIAATRQQMGRAGRREAESIAVLVAGQMPLDQFLMAQPGFFFERGAERALLNPDNLAIAVRHLQCAAYELPFNKGETFGRFPQPEDVLDYLVEDGVLRDSGATYHYVAAGYPAEQVNLRTAGPHTVVITVQEGDAAVTIGEVDAASAPRMVYPGAIYLHEGVSYQITGLDLSGGRAEAIPVSVGYYTRAVTSTELQVLEVAATDETPAIQRRQGEVQVVSQVVGYRQIRRYTHETIAHNPLDLPPETIETSGYWLTLSEDALEILRAAGLWHRDRLDYGPQAFWQRQRAAVRERDGYRCRVCGAPEPPGRQHDVHHLRPLRHFLEEARAQNVNPTTIYRQAHALDNLMTLCATCHRRAEMMVLTANAWAGLAHALHNLAPIFLMCDPHDIGVTQESVTQGDALPTITLYDTAPLGLGFAEQLYDMHPQLLTGARDLAAGCTCRDGCPVCVGPPPNPTVDLKDQTLEMLRLLV